MKKQINFFMQVTLFVGCFFTTFLQSSTVAEAQDGFRVTEAVLKAEDPKMSGKCPIRVNFTGYVTANGAGTVKYTFARNDGATAPVYALDFKEAGTQTVTTDWTLGDAAVLPFYEGWQTIKILSPNELESSRETGAFSIKCATDKNKQPDNKTTEFLPLPNLPDESTKTVVQPIVSTMPGARTIWEFMNEYTDSDKAIRLQKSFAVGHLMTDKSCSGAMISPHIFMSAGHCGGPGWMGFVRFVRIDEDSATPGSSAQAYSEWYSGRTFPWVSGSNGTRGDTQLWWLENGSDGVPPGIKYGYLELNPTAVRVSDKAYSFWLNPINNFRGSPLDWTILYSSGEASNRHVNEWRGPSTDFNMFGIGGSSGSAVNSGANHEVVGVTSAAPRGDGGFPRTTADADHFLRDFDSDRNQVLDAVEYDWLMTQPVMNLNLFQFASRSERSKWMINPVPRNAGAFTTETGGWSGKVNGSAANVDGLWNRTAKFVPNATYRISAAVRGTGGFSHIKFWSDTGGAASEVKWQFSTTPTFTRVTGRVTLRNFSDYRLIIGMRDRGELFVQDLTIVREDGTALNFETGDERRSWEYFGKSYPTSWGINGANDFSAVVEGPAALCLRNRFVGLRPYRRYEVTFTAKHVAGDLAGTPFFRVQDLSGAAAFNQYFNFTAPNEEKTVTATFTVGSATAQTIAFGTGGAGFRFMVDNIRIRELE